MKLTYADRETIWAVIENDDWIRPGELITEANIIGRVYLAGKRAGREDMRERAAKVCKRLHDWQTINNQEYGREWHDAADAAAAGVRALGVDDD